MFNCLVTTTYTYHLTITFRPTHVNQQYCSIYNNSHTITLTQHVALTHINTHTFAQHNQHILLKHTMIIYTHPNNAHIAVRTHSTCQPAYYTHICAYHLILVLYMLMRIHHFKNYIRCTLTCNMFMLMQLHICKIYIVTTTYIQTNNNLIPSNTQYTSTPPNTHPLTHIHIPIYTLYKHINPGRNTHQPHHISSNTHSMTLYSPDTLTLV